MASPLLCNLQSSGSANKNSIYHAPLFAVLVSSLFALALSPGDAEKCVGILEEGFLGGKIGVFCSRSRVLRRFFVSAGLSDAGFSIAMMATLHISQCSLLLSPE